MSDKGWHRTFADPIPLPNGGRLHTLRDAGNYITKLPTREHDTPAWRAAIQALILVAEHGGDTMLPRIAIMRARRGADSEEEAGEEISDCAMIEESFGT